jgi:hypothetical protein
LDIPDQLFKKAKARAALSDLSLKDFVCRALREKLSSKRSLQKNARDGWRSVFGRASKAEVAEADRAIEAAFEQIDPAEWQ